MEILTWQQVKDFANQLSEKDLKQPVKAWGEDGTMPIIGIDSTEEDRYYDGIMYIPKSCFDNFDEDCEDPSLILPKGTIRLSLAY